MVKWSGQFQAKSPLAEGGNATAQVGRVRGGILAPILKTKPSLTTKLHCVSEKIWPRIRKKRVVRHPGDGNMRGHNDRHRRRGDV